MSLVGCLLVLAYAPASGSDYRACSYDAIGSSPTGGHARHAGRTFEIESDGCFTIPEDRLQNRRAIRLTGDSNFADQIVWVGTEAKKSRFYRLYPEMVEYCAGPQAGGMSGFTDRQGTSRLPSPFFSNETVPSGEDLRFLEIAGFRDDNCQDPENGETCEEAWLKGLRRQFQSTKDGTSSRVLPKSYKFMLKQRRDDLSSQELEELDNGMSEYDSATDTLAWFVQKGFILVGHNPRTTVRLTQVDERGLVTGAILFSFGVWREREEKDHYLIALAAPAEGLAGATRAEVIEGINSPLDQMCSKWTFRVPPRTQLKVRKRLVKFRKPGS